MTAEEIMGNAAALLNDSEQLQWTDAILLPYVKKAWAEFTLRVKEWGVVTLKEVSATLEIPTTKTTITVTDITDLNSPLELSERLDGTSDNFVPMTETSWEPSIDKSESLRFWNWREGEIKLVGATTPREVSLKYLKGLAAISSASSVIPAPFNDAQLFLESRTAAIAAALSGGNFERAAALDNDAERHFQSYLNMTVKQGQGIGIRRKGYRR